MSADDGTQGTVAGRTGRPAEGGTRAKARARKADEAVPGFDFEHGGRSYRCGVGEQRGDRTDAWWWVVVDGDRNRYAAFRAASDDTQASVRERVVAFYEQRLAPRVFTSWRDRRNATPAS